MSDCPVCGGKAQAATQDAATGEPFSECGNGHAWPADRTGNAAPDD